MIYLDLWLEGPEGGCMRFLLVLLVVLVGCTDHSHPPRATEPDPPDTTMVSQECRECRDDCLEAFPPSRDPVGFQDCNQACKEGPCGSYWKE